MTFVGQERLRAGGGATWLALLGAHLGPRLEQGWVQGAVRHRAQSPRNSSGSCGVEKRPPQLWGREERLRAGTLEPHWQLLTLPEPASVSPEQPWHYLSPQGPLSVAQVPVTTVLTSARLVPVTTGGYHSPAGQAYLRPKINQSQWAERTQCGESRTCRLE